MTEVRQLLDVAIVALAWGLAFGVVGETRELPASAFPPIVVRIYDAAGTPTEFQQSALLVAAAILDRAGVSVRGFVATRTPLPPRAESRLARTSLPCASSNCANVRLRPSFRSATLT